MNAFTGDQNPVLDSGAFDAAFVVVPVLMGVIIVVGIAVSIYRAAKVARSGQNPLTLDNDIAVAALRSPVLAPTKTLEQRLQEVDDLHSRGVISDDEHRAARATILQG